MNGRKAEEEKLFCRGAASGNTHAITAEVAVAGTDFWMLAEATGVGAEGAGIVGATQQSMPPQPQHLQT